MVAFLGYLKEIFWENKLILVVEAEIVSMVLLHLCEIPLQALPYYWLCHALP
jgi:hypothetical protein